MALYLHFVLALNELADWSQQGIAQVQVPNGSANRRNKKVAFLSFIAGTMGPRRHARIIILTA